MKAVQGKQAKGNLGKSKAEKKTTVSLVLKIAVASLKKQLTGLVHEIFQLYTNLLMEEAHQHWDTIVKEQTELSPFHDIFKVKWVKSQGKSNKPFAMCQLIHLQQVCFQDAGENLKFYISNCLKKPNKEQVHQVIQCILQLNTYTEDLLCLYHSSSTNVQTDRVYSSWTWNNHVTSYACGR